MPPAHIGNRVSRLPQVHDSIACMRASSGFQHAGVRGLLGSPLHHSQARRFRIMNTVHRPPEGCVTRCSGVAEIIRTVDVHMSLRLGGWFLSFKIKETSFWPCRDFMPCVPVPLPFGCRCRDGSSISRFCVISIVVAKRVALIG